MGRMKETDDDKAVTRKALENSGAKLLEHVVGLEDLRERMAELKEQERDKLAAAKSDGFDKKAIKTVIKRRAETEEQAAARSTLATVVDLYLQAVTDAESA